ncbi:hypothetical protein ACVWWI_004507 [Bradyrhizobium sp. USDA 3686]|nr:hypothetical protein [Bradyrhizobium canariense]
MTVALKADAKLSFSVVSFPSIADAWWVPFQGWKSNVDYNDFTQMNPF